MTVGEFAEALVHIRRHYGGWVTSWGRTDRHSQDVRGFANDPHTWDLGADMLYHEEPKLDELRTAAASVGLRVIREVSHDHYQPLDMPSGPLTHYGGQEKTWT